MAKRLSVPLLPEWSDYSHDNPNGPPTYYRRGNEGANALQVSWAWYTGGEEPRPDDKALIQLATDAFGRAEGVELVATDSGECTVGRFGMAIARSARFPRIQSWVLSNGLDFVLVTHVCAVGPSELEMAEVEQIVKALAITDGG